MSDCSPRHVPFAAAEAPCHPVLTSLPRAPNPGDGQQGTRGAAVVAGDAAACPGGRGAGRQGEEAVRALPQGQVLRCAAAGRRPPVPVLVSSRLSRRRPRLRLLSSAERKRVVKAQEKLRKEVEAQGWVRPPQQRCTLACAPSPDVGPRPLAARRSRKGQRGAARAPQAAGRGRGVCTGAQAIPQAIAQALPVEVRRARSRRRLTQQLLRSFRAFPKARNTWRSSRRAATKHTRWLNAPGCERSSRHVFTPPPVFTLLRVLCVPPLIPLSPLSRRTWPLPRCWLRRTRVRASSLAVLCAC